MLYVLTLLAIAAGLAILAILCIAALRPSHFLIQRSATIQALPEAIFPLIENFHEWERWSPFEDKDPAMNRRCSGAARGRRAVYTWE